MKAIDIKNIASAAGLQLNQIAQHLFPTNKHPGLALKRVIAGKGTLSAAQARKLASMAGITLDEAYSGNWKHTGKGREIRFTRGSYEAHLDTETWVTKVFDTQSLIHEEVLFSGAMSLKDYLLKLDTLITKHKKL